MVAGSPLSQLATPITAFASGRERIRRRITIDASFCEQASDHDFCALIEHELYHIGVERDQDDEIMYSDNTGLPKHYLAGHDVEEFYGVVKRWGANESVKRLVEITKNAPFVSETNIAACCGNCVIG